MAIVHRIRTNEDVVNGLVTVQPRADGTIDSTDGSESGQVAPRAQHIGTGHDPAQWGTLASRYINDPSGWSS